MLSLRASASLFWGNSQVKHIDEPREETKAQGGLFDARGRQKDGWTNKLIWGHDKLILSSLKSGALRRQIEEAGGRKLIYIGFLSRKRIGYVGLSTVAMKKSSLGSAGLAAISSSTRIIKSRPGR